MPIYEQGIAETLENLITELVNAHGWTYEQALQVIQEVLDKLKA